MNRIAIVTRDCAGINAAIRAVVRTASVRGVQVLGVMRGYAGLMNGDFVPLDRRSVSGIINLGGTILKTARADAFFEEDGQRKAVAAVRAAGIDGLVVIGGDGSLAGAHVLAGTHGLRTVGIPATIDNDINDVELSVGTDTAVNVALDAVDKIRDTATSLERIFVIEVMGRGCGYIAMQVALAGGCEEVLLPEKPFDMKAVSDEILAGNAQGKVSWILVVAEGLAKAEDVAAAVSLNTGLETRIAVLGHIQRGGRPTAADRLLASRLGHRAVLTLLEGGTDVCVSLREGRPILVPLAAAIRPKRIETEADYQLLKVLS